MAAGSLPKPGSELGPCKDEQCLHRDCIENRKMATQLCTICNKPIGYDTRFYEDQSGMQHAICVEEQIENESNDIR